MAELVDPLLPNDDIVFREEFDDCAVLFNPETGDAVGVNPVGVVVWKLIDGERSLEDIVGIVTETFSDTPESANEDIAGFLDNLAEYGFLQHTAEADR